MADIISSIASAVAEYLVTPIGRQLGYLFNYHSNVEDLKTQVEKLGDVRGRIERSVNAARRNDEEIEPGVEKWLNSVNGITEKAGEILLEDEDKAKKRFFNGLCPNLKSRYRLSRKAKKTTEKVVVEIQDGEKFGTVSYHPASQGTIGSTAIKGYEGFESRMSTLKEIMEALRNPNINMIGVYGMGGVGKTMLVKEAAGKAMEEKLFDKVAMAVVSQAPKVRKIQEEIASPLGLIFDDKEIESERVERLCKRLNEEKSILIILDDVWAQLDLEALGIPLGDMQNGCKIVVTSRRLNLLSNQMNTQKNFEIGQLLEKEAWDLFTKMAGDSVEAPEIRPIALKVAQECAGLPIAIVVVASALKNMRLHVWKNALYQLQKSAPTTIEGMNAKVYSSLKLSYDFLECEAQKLFLLCSLLPEDYQFSIQDLLYYGKGVGLFQGIEALEIARDSVHVLVDHLRASCLLLDGDTSGWFIMHDVVRDVAISVASKDKHMSIVRNSSELEEWMTEEQLESRSAISLPYIDIHELPTCFESPALKFFLFYSINGSSKIPDSFFGGMKQLKVLTLRNMHFSSLPSSLHFLSSLQTLCLDECTLPDVSIIGELKKLEILSFRSSKIEELPREIGQLTRLKLLDLRDCEALDVIPPNVIASLSQLEELYMRDSFNGWEVDGNASFAELKHLSRLVTLEIRIRDANILLNDLVFEKLTRYKICIGDFGDWSDDFELSRTLYLAVNTSIHLLSGINKLLKRTEDLYLEKLNGLKSILNDSDGEGFHDMRHLHVGSSSEIEYVIDTSVPFSAFHKLESLLLRNLINLKEICHGQLTVESFSNLRSVEVIDCDRLQNLFPLSVARRLSKLQEIKIQTCKNMDGIVAEGREAAEENYGAVYKILFPQLQSLKVEALPKLVSFCSKVKAVPSTSDAGSKEIISFSEAEHGISIPLFNEKDTFPNLEKLDIRSISMKEMWHSQLLDGSFCKLRVLEVRECFHLSNIVPSNMLTKLPNMTLMWVESCGDCLEYIFDVGGINHTESRHVVRTSCELSALHLSDLPGLINIWKNDSPGVFPLEKLSSVVVQGCPTLKNIFTSFRAKTLVQLQFLRILDCDELEEIVGKEGVDEEEATSKIVFPEVSYLNLRLLPQLKSFCQGICMSEWPHLWTLRVSFCHNVEILASEPRCFKETCGKVLFLVDKVTFPNLKDMELSYMSSMEVIWQGQFHAHSFCKLRVLKVQKCDKLLKVFPISLLRNLQNLEKLYVKDCCSLEDVFELEGGVGEAEHASTFPPLRKLRLIGLPKLMHLWKEDSQLSAVFQNLKTLKVRSCGSLTHVFPSTRAKGPVQIESTNDVSDKGEATDETTFCQLYSLELKDLPNLTSFCPGSNNFFLPSLEKVFVEECPKLKTFSTNTLHTPKLEKVQLKEGKWLWDGDLNTTIQHLFKEKAEEGTEDAEED